MIWAEVPVDAGDNSNRPPGWRITDVDRKDRWCYDSKVDPDDKTADREREEQEKLDDEVEEMLEDVSNKQTSSFAISSQGCSQDDPVEEEDSSHDQVEPRDWMDEEVYEDDEENSPELQPLSQARTGLFCDLTRPPLDDLAEVDDDEDPVIEDLDDEKMSQEIEEQENEQYVERSWKGNMLDPEDIEYSDDDDDYFTAETLDDSGEDMKDLVGDFLETLDDNTQPKQWWKKHPWQQTLSEFVVSRMAHDPCGAHVPGGKYCRCMRNGKCSAKMPRDIRQDTDGCVDGYAAYRRREFLLEDDMVPMPTKKKFVSRWVKGGKRGKNGILCTFDGRWLPGYNPALLMKYRLHINVEYCGSIKAINYLYKYIYLHGSLRNCNL